MRSGSERGAYPLRAVAGVLDARETILAIDRDVGRGVGVGTIAARFHHALADATAAECAQLASDRGIDKVVLVGRRVPEPPAAGTDRRRGCEEAGLRVLVPERLPPNDGGIAFGQAAVAAAAAQLTRRARMWRHAKKPTSAPPTTPPAMIPPTPRTFSNAWPAM